MKKFLIALVLLTQLAFIPAVALAQNQGRAIDLSAKVKTLGEGAGFNSSRSLPATVGLIIRVLISIIGVLFLIYAVYAGYLWLTARGNEDQVTKAKDILRGSIIGIIIVLAAYAITAFVVSRVITATGYSAEQQSN